MSQTPIEAAQTISGRTLGRYFNGRRLAVTTLILTIVILVMITIIGILVPESAYAVNFAQRDTAPSLDAIFGTDWLGRDMAWRTLKGLSISIRIGLFASLVSSLIAIALGLAAATWGGKVDSAVLWLVDLFQGMPHLIFMIFVAILTGRGITGIMVGVALTHWTSLARVVRAETLYLHQAPYVNVARQLGKSRLHIATRHYLPHIVPQAIIATILMFPHAILHESALTFLGFGIPQEIPAIGVILSESMRYLSTGSWWLAIFPGLALMAIVLIFDRLGKALGTLLSPAGAQN